MGAKSVGVGGDGDRAYGDGVGMGAKFVGVGWGWGRALVPVQLSTPYISEYEPHDQGHRVGL